MSFKRKIDDKSLKIELDKTELKDVLQYCKPKEQIVLIKKFWLGDWQELALQTIWNEYWLTRERIRQIENQGLMRFRRLIFWNEKYIKVIEEAKKIIDSHNWLLDESSLMSKLINKNISKLSSQELKLVLVSDFDIYYLKRNKIVWKCFYLEPLYEDLLSQISQDVLSHFENSSKSEELESFTAWIKRKYISKYPSIDYLATDEFYHNLFGVIKGISVFDNKIWLSDFSEVNPKTIKEKIHYVLRKLNKPIHFQELSDKLFDWFPEKWIKVNTVHNELVKNNEIFVNMGLGIYWLKEWGYQGWTVKEIIERILNTTSRPLTIKEITKEVLKEKMVSPNTVILTLQKFDNFKRVAKWTYVLNK